MLAAGGLLAVQQCTPWPPAADSRPARTVAAAPATEPAPVPVGPLIQALLDTAGAPPAARDAHLGLQAGAAVRSFYGPAPEPAWTRPGPDGLTADATAVLALLADARAYGLHPNDYSSARLRALRDSLQQADPARQSWQQARLEVYLSDAVLRFMLDLHRGRLRPYTLSPLETAAKRTFQPAEALRTGIAAGRAVPAVLTSQPQNREYQLLQQALVQWLRQPVPPDSAAQHQRQYEQVALNLERWRWQAFSDEEYVLINLPAFALQVVAGDSIMRRHRVVVGKPETPTPTLSSRIGYFTLAPDWHVPRSIATKEILPRLKANPGYLARNNYSLYDSRGQLLNPYQVNWQAVTGANFRYTIRQSAGCDNALGNIVFRFANPYSVYLHDTPTRQFFALPQRAFSHGCIRLQHPMELAAYLLRREGRPVQLPSEAECALQPQARDVRLRRPMPLHIRYFTCAVDSGQLRFYPDIYGRDLTLRRALFTTAPPAAGQTALANVR
ncbi:hypothetical protein GCM10023186_29750 [Hymenobacter koreensis]|uniref:L,D-TPase catalytic domain-containing protein n=2 Tax=Hymenobacter koreensis TaxID=1084523 RepID=A0ABP8J6B3_9BACT